MTSETNISANEFHVPQELRDFILASEIALSLSSSTLEDTPLVLVNNAFERLTGYKDVEILGKNCRFLQGENTRKEPCRKIRAMIENPQTVSEQVLIQNYRKNGEPFENFLFLFRLNHAPLETAYFLGSQFDTSQPDLAGRFKLNAEKLSAVVSRVSNIYFRDRDLDDAGKALMSMTIDAVAQARAAAAALKKA